MIANAAFNSIRYKKELIRRYPTDLIEFEKFLISVNPVYEWFIDNADKASYKLIKAFITNIVPLGHIGKKYFKRIANKKQGVTIELWKLYNDIEKQYWIGDFEIATYYELRRLGFKGIQLGGGGDCPVDSIFKFIGKEAIRISEAILN
ncbi:hypothetical protein HBE96_21790 [Clostridium sp. P21]|uniref:Uncharacterized protein n=1 Tax=Clostridium muellerianum TaxID=2716538 RepID=A0A7Y0HPM8_9CLOT|nr:hypothetical protein [Clostridium muellerianum]NMM65219.1 hypothetical protein [Clostridium muellerianum]